jgi:ribosomal protein S18 acetylase RimI-like enzyme
VDLPEGTGWPAAWSEVVRLVEQLAANSWPAGMTQLVDGWLFRVTPGIRRRRSNSALPLFAAPGPAASHRTTVDRVEAFYRRHGQAAWVQVSPTELHTGLDEELARRGYERVVPIDVMLAPIDRTLAGTAAAPGLTVRADPAVSAGWLAAQLRVEPRPAAAQAAEARWVLGRICPPAVFLTALSGGTPVGVCLLAAERGWAGVFSMATHPDARRRGVAATLLRRGAQWAARQGARSLYLQVDTDNEPALGLYARAGFRRAYGYHYRAAPAVRRSPVRDLVRASPGSGGGVTRRW